MFGLSLAAKICRKVPPTIGKVTPMNGEGGKGINLIQWKLRRNFAESIQKWKKNNKKKRNKAGINGKRQQAKLGYLKLTSI